MFALAVKRNPPAQTGLSSSPHQRSKASTQQQEQARKPLLQHRLSPRNFAEIAIFPPGEQSSIPVQAKLTVGAVHDPLEVEADRMADHVIGASGSTHSIPTTAPHAEVPGSVENLLASAGQPLTAHARAFMEPRFGHNFSQVKVHDGSAAASSANQIGARAYTVGRQIVFAAGQYQPGTVDGRRLLAHELTHVIQQTGPTTSQRPVGLIQRQPDDKNAPASPAQKPDRNSLDDKAKAIIAAAQDSSKPIDQRAIAAVNDIVKAYYDPSLVDSVVYVEGEDGLMTTPIGKGQAIKGKITVGKDFIEHIDKFARRVLQVGHELQHVQQQRDGKGGHDKSSLREFLAFYWEATQPEKAGTGRMSHTTRVDLIDEALRNYYRLPDADQTTNADKKDELLKLRSTEETKSGRPHTDPPAASDAKK